MSLKKIKTLLAGGNPAEALQLASEHISLGSLSHEIHFLTGRALIELGRPSEALMHLELASKEAELMDIEDRLLIARFLISCGGEQRATQLLLSVLAPHKSRAPRIKDMALALDLLLVLEQSTPCLNALSNLYTTFEQEDNFVQFLLLLSKALTSGGHDWDALETLELCLKVAPTNEDVHHAISTTLARLSLHDDADNHLKFIKKLNPEFKSKAISLDFFQACKTGSFELQETLKSEWFANKDSTQDSRGAFAALIATDDPSFIFQQNKLFAECLYLDRQKKAAKLTAPFDFRSQKRMRICYISPDFGNHAVTHLITDLIALHNRDHFEVYGIGIAPHGESKYRQKIVSNFDHFVDHSDLSTGELAKAVNHYDFDVVLDLAGYTRGFRSTLFHRLNDVAIVNYLGYPSTSGHQQYHYIFGDEIVTPASDQQFISEKILNLKCCYQANSPTREVHTRDFESTQLPKDTFVFCNFNTRQKLNLESLSAWKEILRKCSEGILWLLDPGEKMRAEISLVLGEMSHRVYFAEQLSIESHLGRVGFANLFLDNFPYGAHTTASDSIFCGVPVLSRSGNSFQSRVSKSIMFHSGVDYLDAPDWEVYKEKAISFYESYTDDKKSEFARILTDFEKPGHPYNVRHTAQCIDEIFKKMLVTN